MRRKRFKIPVLSRLTQAWIALGVMAVCVGAFFLTEREGASRIALAVDRVPERLARPSRIDERPERLPQPPIPVAARVDSDDDREPFAIDTDDALPLNGTVGPRPADFADTDDDLDISPLAEDDVVITIDGKPARTPGNPEDRDAARRRRTAANVTLASADAALSRETAFGRAPAIARDGRTASQYYARPFALGDTPTVSLIVGGLGLNRALTERAIDELPPDVTLAFAPYARDLDFWTKKARDAGHEVLLELPMEAGRGDVETLGPAALLTTRTSSENLQRLEWLLSRYQGYVGVTNYLGAKFSGDQTAMRPVLSTLKSSGLAYFDDTGAAARITGGDPAIATVDRLISSGDGTGGARVIAELRAVEAIAEEKGKALAKAPLYASTLSDLASWARSIEGGEDITLAPASVVLKRSAPAL